MSTNTTTRIYQGTVVKVQVLDTEGKAQPSWKDLSTWREVLWSHHELFQDAVNYYTLALAAMALGAPRTSDEDNALRTWADQVRQTWVQATRGADRFEGPHRRLAAVLGLPEDKTDFDTAAAKVLAPSRATPEQRAAALKYLLTMKGDLNQICVEMLPWLATRAGKLHATSKSDKAQQEVTRQQIVRQYHQEADQQALERAHELDLGWFIAQRPAEEQYYQGNKAAEVLRGYFRKVAAKSPSVKALSDQFNKHLEVSCATLKILSPGRKTSGLYPFAALFKYFPTSETLAAFREATRALATGKHKEAVGNDPVAEARVDDQPHFDYFTNLACVTGAASEHDTRAVWFGFDLAAFIEAIKAPRRYWEDTKEREAAAQRIQNQIAAMEGRGQGVNSADDLSEPLPGFEGDQRITLLKKIVQQRLAWIAEAEGDQTPSASREYSIRERTLRGFAEIKRRWRAVAQQGNVTEQHLLDILAEEQSAHRDDFGSAAFYRELARSGFHSIWRDPGTQPWHADDPLAAWLLYQNLRADLEDKRRSIRFTPAHPIYSPRFFIFPKKSETKAPTSAKRLPKPGLESRHDAGQLSFTAGVLVQAGNKWTPTIMRIHYSAPRLCRDYLRFNKEASLYEAPWLQPMMAALGFDQATNKVNFANCRIILQPSEPKTIHLGFPLEVTLDNIHAAVGSAARWDQQFNQHPDGKKFYNASLRWPHELRAAQKAAQPWYERLARFSCVSVDLGQRNAGAFARLTARAESTAPTTPARFIGATPGKQWYATLDRAGLFHLPGENATVWRAQSRCDQRNAADSGKPFDFREELWGERGRPARPWELDETEELMHLLEATEVESSGSQRCSLLPDDWRTSLSFPEQNDKLLVALRRYHSRIARLHRWCWLLNDSEDRKKIAWKELAECDDTRLITAEVKERAARQDPRVAEDLAQQLRARLAAAPELLVRVANRILPLRGRSWRWERHPDAPPENPLYRLTQRGPALDSPDRPVWLRGQRGLSLARIEQIEELRKRCQALNQLQRRSIGKKAPARRDESVPDPCPDLLEKLEHLKEQRVNQTAHMILAEALGLRLAPPPADKKEQRRQRDLHGTYVKITDKNGQWIGPVDFIVIEDLSRYRSSQGRAPRENSRLMKWCHRAVRDKLHQLCEVFGIPVLETPAAYSSRFCSRSGVPGFRAAEVTAGFTKHGHWAWLAAKKDKSGLPTQEARQLLELDRQLCAAQSHLERSRTARLTSQPCPRCTFLLPMPGGPVFVPIVNTVSGSALQPAIMQADINAAINIGLRAIADPRVWSIHPLLRTQRAGATSTAHTRKRAAKTLQAPPAPQPQLVTREKRKFGHTPHPVTIQCAAEAQLDDVRQPNFFADLAGLETQVENHADSTSLTNPWTTATIQDPSLQYPMLHTSTFWGAVNALQWHRCMEINRARLECWGLDDDLKY